MKKRVEVTIPFLGLCFMQVCAVKDATDEEILEVANYENPSGTMNGWVKVAREDNEDRINLWPVDCEEDKDRRHFIIIC